MTQESGNCDVVIQVVPIQFKIAPLGFHQYASEFLRAAQSFQSENPHSPVPYYLYSHSLELVLKAFLLAKGISMEEIKKQVGHDLIKVLNRAKKEGLDQFVNVKEEQKKRGSKG